MICASAYGWLVAQGLWPTMLGALLYWGVPALIGWLLGRRALKRAWQELADMWRAHTSAQRQLARALADHAESQQQVAAQLERLQSRP